MTLVGTIRKNRKEIPPILLNMKKKPVGHTEFVFEHNLGACMLSYVPKKRRFVSLLSTYHSSVHIDAMDPQRKPDIIKFYNQTKGGVDTLDKLVGTYRCKRKVNRWPVALFCNMLDVSASNAFVIFTSLNPEWKITKKNYRRRLFLVEIGESLCLPFIEQRKKKPYGENALRVVNRVQNNQNEEESTSEQTPELITHAPATKKRARCYMCPSRSNANLHSIRCDKCVKYICPTHRFTFCEQCTK